MRKVLSISLLLLMSLAILGGCATGTGTARQTGIQMDTVAILDPSLWNKKSYKISIEGNGARRTPTDTVEVWTQIRNHTGYPLQIEWRVQFFDQNKAPVEGPTAWQRVQLPPQALSVCRQSSLGTENLNHYYIEIREGR